MWLEQLVLKKAEKKLLPYRARAESFTEETAAEYQRYLPQISTLYTRATHWHGTGRHHYMHQEGSRYEGISKDGVVDVLASILASGGLTPHTDPWIDSGGKTVSLATVRMHARAFARIHSYEKDILLYELGSIKFWLRLYFLLLLLWLCADFRRQMPFIKSLFRASFFKDIQAYARTIRAPNKGRVVSVFDIFRGVIPVSDIVGNYPVLFGIAAVSEDLIETVPLTHRVEQRSLKAIPLAQCTHIEVPLRYVVQTKELLKRKGLCVPIVPLECGDAYLALQPLSVLAYAPAKV